MHGPFTLGRFLNQPCISFGGSNPWSGFLQDPECRIPSHPLSKVSVASQANLSPFASLWVDLWYPHGSFLHNSSHRTLWAYGSFAYPWYVCILLSRASIRIPNVFRLFVIISFESNLNLLQFFFSLTHCSCAFTACSGSRGSISLSPSVLFFLARLAGAEFWFIRSWWVQFSSRSASDS